MHGRHSEGRPLGRAHLGSVCLLYANITISSFGGTMMAEVTIYLVMRMILAKWMIKMTNRRIGIIHGGDRGMTDAKKVAVNFINSSRDFSQSIDRHGTRYSSQLAQSHLMLILSLSLVSRISCDIRSLEHLPRSLRSLFTSFWYYSTLSFSDSSTYTALLFPSSRFYLLFYALAIAVEAFP